MPEEQHRAPYRELLKAFERHGLTGRHGDQGQLRGHEFNVRLGCKGTDAGCVDLRICGASSLPNPGEVGELADLLLRNLRKGTGSDSQIARVYLPGYYVACANCNSPVVRGACTRACL